MPDDDNEIRVRASSVDEAIDAIVALSVSSQGARVTEMGPEYAALLLRFLDSNMQTLQSITTQVADMMPMTPALAQYMVARFWVKVTEGMVENLRLDSPDVHHDGRWPVQTWHSWREDNGGE